MDLNLTVIAGRLATQPEVKTYESGATSIRMLVTVRTTEPRRRVDVIPVTLWDPSDDAIAKLSGDVKGEGIWISGSVQRRFWNAHDGGRSRIEIVADQVELRIGVQA